jgi:ABC-type cobalamin/Fe3+-siderophores transport system ATPase subunit
MITNHYKRGSEWRNWDLHVHTPETKLNDKYLLDDNQDKWDLFCEKIENSDVSVFGITDYFSVENYFSFVEKFETKYSSSKKIFFPNVEFRIDSKNSKSEHIQFHVIFSNKQTTLDKLNNFFTRLELISTDNKNLTNKYCIKTDLSEIGYDKAMVKIDELEKKLKNDFTDDEYLIVGVANGYGSLRPNGSTDGRGSEYAKELDKKCKLFFGSSKNTDFFLNKIDGRSQYDLLPKPILFGCDAHSFYILEKKLGKSFEEKNEQEEIKDYAEITWIKADPTFEGLKQIVYEPEGRVKTQELKPEEKNIYETIDKVKFIDDSFAPNEILINQNLTAIIGGKSTGKSILLREIARTIAPKEVEKRLEKAKIKDYPEEIINKFVVFWKDLRKDEKSEIKENRKIIYIPQSYLNRLTDESESSGPIDELIKEVLEQEEDVKNVFSQLQDQNREIEKSITQSIEDIFYKENDINKISESIRKIGDKEGIESEIEKLKKEISELKKKAGMNDEEISEYNELLEKITNLKNKQEQVEKDLQALSTLKYQKNFGVFTKTQNLLESLDSNIQNLLRKNLDTVLEETEIKWKDAIENEYKKLDKQKTENENELKKLYNSFNPLLEKAQKSKSLNEKIKKLDEEEKKLKEITEQENNREKLITDYKKLIKVIPKNHSKFFDNFFNAKTEILKQRIITGELTFDIDIMPKNKAFDENFVNDICNLTSLSSFKEVSLSNYKISKNSSDFERDIEKILNGILQNDLKLKNSYSRKEAITKLVQNWFIFDYKIKQNGDEISEMSPGKKSFVLLKLLIELDNSKCPILLDQPEDDLDNRSIYNDLVKFIKTKKKERQIIIATHNPNLVVGADSECVIVANQKGDKSENRTYKFEYIQGALENTFLNENTSFVLEQRGIQEHVCDILEGGKVSFEQRKKKYNF